MQFSQQVSTQRKESQEFRSKGKNACGQKKRKREILRPYREKIGSLNDKLFITVVINKRNFQSIFLTFVKRERKRCGIPCVLSLSSGWCYRYFRHRFKISETNFPITLYACIYIDTRIAKFRTLRYGYFDVEYRLMKLSGNSSRARCAVMRTMRRSSNIYQPHGILQQRTARHAEATTNANSTDQRADSSINLIKNEYPMEIIRRVRGGAFVRNLVRALVKVVPRTRARSRLHRD